MSDEGYSSRIENRDGYVMILRNDGQPNKNGRVYQTNVGGFSEDEVEAFIPYDPTSSTENFIFPNPRGKGSLVGTLPGGPVVLPIIKRMMPKLMADMILGVEMSEPPPPEQECLPSSFLNKKRMIDDAVDVTAQHKHNSPTLLTNEQLSRSA